MSKKDLIDDAEKSEFREAMGNVAPIEQNKHHHQKKLAHPKPQHHHDPEPSPSQNFYVSSLDYLADEQWVAGDTVLYFHRPGLQHKLLQKLRTGKINITARLDLHRMLADEACAAIERFIENCHQQHQRFACIVHGKGHRSADKPVLKNIVNQSLRQQHYVVAFHSAPPNDGGTGAVYVVIR